MTVQHIVSVSVFVIFAVAVLFLMVSYAFAADLQTFDDRMSNSTVSFDNTPTDMPETFILSSVFADLLTGSLKIGYGLPYACSIELSIYDLSGNKIKMLATGNLQAGYYTTNVAGIEKGMYTYRLIAGEFTETKKIFIQ